MIEKIRGLTELTFTNAQNFDEAIWPGGEGTLYSNVACMLKVKTPNQTVYQTTDIGFTDAAGGIQNFSLGVGFLISLSATGFVTIL